MTIATGTIQYQLGTAPVTGCGFSYSADELDTALSGPVAKVVYDDSGKADIEALVAGLAETDFEKGEVERILSDAKPPEDWRVGEALAESYLVHQKGCFFPWPDGRDERKSGSSLPGADLVGFQFHGTDDFFAFGEVKTSTESKYPPGAMYGRTGLKQQLEDLKDDVKIKDDILAFEHKDHHGKTGLNEPQRITSIAAPMCAFSVFWYGMLNPIRTIFVFG